MKKAESLLAIATDKSMQKSLSSTFVDRITNAQDRRIITRIILSITYMFEEARMVMQKIYTTSSNIPGYEPIVAYGIFTANLTPSSNADPLATILTAVQGLGNKISELNRLLYSMYGQ
jgi:hypothetical protein